MRGRTHRAPEEANVDLTPMLDVVFILLIFFIVTSTFAQEETIGLELHSRQRSWGRSVHIRRDAGFVALEILIEHQRQFVSRGVVSLPVGPGCLGLEHFGWNPGA